MQTVRLVINQIMQFFKQLHIFTCMLFLPHIVSLQCCVHKYIYIGVSYIFTVTKYQTSVLRKLIMSSSKNCDIIFVVSIMI